MTPQAMRMIENQEARDIETVRALKGTPDFSGTFLVSDLQRLYRWGFNPANRTCRRLVELGELKVKGLGFRFIDRLESPF